MGRIVVDISAGVAAITISAPPMNALRCRDARRVCDTVEET
jgi:hypothetical protein